MPSAKGRQRPPTATVRDIMSTPPIVLPEKTTIDAAAKVMWNKKVGSVIITDAQGRASGIVTERDMVAAIGKGLIGKRVPVIEIMSKNPIRVAPEDTMAQVKKRMRGLNVLHLAVEVDGKPVGVLSIHDVLGFGASPFSIINED